MLRALVVLAILAALVANPALGKGAPQPPPPKNIVVPMTQRPLMAVMRLDDGSLQRQEWWGKSWDIGSGLADVLTSTLMQRNRFRLIERNSLKDVLGEQALNNSAVVDPKQAAAKLGAVKGVDYLMIGKITEFAWGKQDTGGVLGALGVGVSSTEARVAVDLRIIDTTSGEIIGAFAGIGQESKSSFAIAKADVGAFGVGSSNFMQSILGKATRAAMENWCDNCCRAIDAGNLKLVPRNMHQEGKVAAVDGDVIIANIGGIGGYTKGEKVEIHRTGRVIKDPDTGEVLRVSTQVIARGEILSVDEKSSEIKFTCCDPSTPPAAGDLVRFCEPAPVQAPIATAPDTATPPPPVDNTAPPPPKEDKRDDGHRSEPL